MKRLFKSNISKMYVAGMLLIISIILIEYYSYAMFTVRKEKSNTISIVTGSLISTVESSNLDENHNIVIKAGDGTKDNPYIAVKI